MSLFLCFTAKGTSDNHFLAYWGAANFFEVLKGAVNLKRLKNTAAGTGGTVGGGV